MKKSRAPCHNGAMTVHSRSPLRYRCPICYRTFGARRDEISFGSKLSARETLALLGHLKKGDSIRKTATLMGLSPSTVERWKQRFVRKNLLLSPNPKLYERQYTQ